MTIESGAIGVCCVSEAHIQLSSVVILLTSPDQPGESILRLSGDSTVTFRRLAGVDMAISMKVDQMLLEWIPVDSHLCTVR